VRACPYCMSVHLSKRERTGEREYVLSGHNKTYFVAKTMTIICHFYLIVYYIYFLGRCHCGFVSFAVVVGCKDL